MESQMEEPSQPTMIRDIDVVEKPEVVYLCDHEGSRYVFPIDRLRSYEATKKLWEEIYQNSNESHRSRRDKIRSIEDGSYRMQTIDGATILPSAWDAIVRPDSTFQIKFIDSSHMHSPRRPRSWSRSRSSDASRVDRVWDSPEDVRAVTFEVLRPISPKEASESATTTDNDSTGSYASDSDVESSEESAENLDPLPPPRDAVAPVDFEGNKLSFQVNTKPSAQFIMPSKGSGGQEEIEEMRSGNKDVTDGKVETRRITKVLMVESEGRNTLQICTLPGPENNLLQASVTATWYHISAAQLDFDRFRNVCLTIPHLSGRLQTLTREMLTKLQKDMVKPFLGGRFVEPGTVLRADESDQTNPQSVIFSCVPYLSLEGVSKKSLEPTNSLFPPRTLMQSFYPYEPVRERDEEQSYRKFNNDHARNIIHVPNLWIMNIGSSAVVTCGHQPLSEAMGRSINIVEEDIKQLGKQGIPDNELTDICITNLDGRRFVFPVSSCRSYFQLEAKVFELNYTPGDRLLDSKIKLELQTGDGSMTIGPGDWKKVVTRAANLVAINITVSNDHEDRPVGDASSANQAALAFSTYAPPFFHWRPSKINSPSKSNGKFISTSTMEPHGSAACLEQVEKAMTSRILEHPLETIEYAFASTDYYQALPEAKYSDIYTKRTELDACAKRAKHPVSGITFHQRIVRTQLAGILERSVELFDTIQATLKLFESDLDCSITLRKISGALENIYKHVMSIEQHGSFEPGHNSDLQWKHPDLLGRTWFIRSYAHPYSVSLPDASNRLKKSILQCKRCSGMRWFDNPQAALDHVERHATKSADPTGANTVPKPDKLSQNVPLYGKPHDWVINDAQHRREHTNAGALAILTQACTIAKDMLIQVRDLAKGVENEDGQISSLYSMPQGLVEAFRKIVIFYLGNERALYETGKIYERDALLQEDYTRFPYSEAGLGVLKSFGKDAERSLRLTRLALCKMARPVSPLEISKHLSMGPEFVCAWLMRRLLVKPLERSKTVGDMFREYVSKVQFEVNDRPSKRLLRSINLIQEELQVLISVNSWQTNLVQNYLSVLDDSTYETDMPSRRGMFPYERTLVDTCLDNLSLAREDYVDLIHRCGPLSDRTKQMLEINEEDHGKAIMVFTVVTVIFLPLSFVTSYFGMNTVDIRDMNQKQSLFWSVAIPLTLVTVGSCLLIGYNGDEIRHSITSLYHKALGRDGKMIEAGGISVPQRKRPLKPQSGSNSMTVSFSGAAEAEFASPLPELPTRTYELEVEQDWYQSRYETSSRWDTSLERTYRPPEVRTQSYAEPISMTAPPPPPPAPRYRPSRKDNYDELEEFVPATPPREETRRYDDIYANPLERTRSNYYYYYPNRTRPGRFARRSSGPLPISTRSDARRAGMHGGATALHQRIYDENQWTRDNGDEYKWIKKSRKP